MTSTPSGMLSMGRGACIICLEPSLLSRPCALTLFLPLYTFSLARGRPEGWERGRSPDRDTPLMSMFVGLPMRDKGCSIWGRLTPIFCPIEAGRGIPTCDMSNVWKYLPQNYIPVALFLPRQYIFMYTSSHRLLVRIEDLCSTFKHRVVPSNDCPLPRHICH